MKTIKLSLLLNLFVFCGYSQSIEKFSIDSGGASTSAGGIQILYTIGEVVVQEYSTTNLSVSEGFINSSFRLKINPVAYLQGPILNPDTAGLMNDDLRVADLIPTTSPYEDHAICDASVFLVTGNNAIVDWVWVELRDGSDNSIISNAQSAFLQRDGDVVAIDGMSSLSASLPDGNYYVSVSHRNHLGVMSASSFALSGTDTIIDLTSDPNLVTGGNNAVVVLSNGNHGAYAGDYDENNQIQNVDANSVVQLIGGTGYTNADMDANTQIQNTDVNALIQPNIGLGQQFNREDSEREFLDAGITLTFANAQITNDGNDDFYEADVLIASTEDFYIGSGQIYFDYNTDAFGDNISSNNAIEYSQPQTSILGGSYVGLPAYKDFVQNDNNTSRVSLSFQQNFSESFIATNIPDIQTTATPKALFHLKIKFIDASEDPEVCFYNQGVFQDQFYTACGGAGAADCTNNPGEQITDDTYDCSGADIDTLNLDAYQENTIVIFPNPVRKTFEIKGIKNPYDLNIYDVSGKLVLQLSNIINQTIDMSVYENGVYLVEIITDKDSITKKIVVK
ncbi:T9SS type A sorting domain-containing protein [Psychroserpens ponticola]|uniref:T9SS type A sorting domain-containing protein n=1 Tax=Psychroserpens ponticola TaxID=2932268 RepID=A0ABY7RZT2_9FLAO|nr:T9SS type A sorting domain-containing protein [Psychroserpens ponticola]WCO01741.1 T9SS type A sorting domain-containing protein [Psychroserpens ponticola]